MKYIKMLKKLPLVGNKIKRLKLSVKDILLEFFNKKTDIIFIDIGANT